MTTSHGVTKFLRDTFESWEQHPDYNIGIKKKSKGYQVIVHRESTKECLITNSSNLADDLEQAMVIACHYATRLSEG